MSEDQEDVRNFDGLRDFIGRALKDVRENKKEGRKICQSVFVWSTD